MQQIQVDEVFNSQSCTKRHVIVVMICASCLYVFRKSYFFSIFVKEINVDEVVEHVVASIMVCGFVLTCRFFSVDVLICLQSNYSTQLFLISTDNLQSLCHQEHDELGYNSNLGFKTEQVNILSLTPCSVT